MSFNESGDWDKMMAKRKSFYERMENDWGFRMEQVDKKLMTVNALSGSNNRYIRYKSTVIDTLTNDEYEIGIRGELKPYRGGGKEY